MRFSIIKLAVAVLAAGTNMVQSAITPAEMVTNIKSLTTKSQALQAPAQSINLINGPLIVVGLGPFPQIIVGFTDIIQTTTVAIATMQGSAPVPAGASSDAIFDAFREFVRVHQVLLNILIGKAGLLQTIPFVGAPVAQVLRQLESIVDTVALGIIALVQSRADDLRDQAKSLSGTIGIAIKSYEGLQLS